MFQLSVILQSGTASIKSIVYFSVYKCKTFFFFFNLYSIISYDGAEKDVSRTDYETVMNILMMFIVCSPLSTSEKDLGDIR